MSYQQRMFQVTWKVTVWANDRLDAVKEAVRIQRDPESWANYFTVEEIVAAGLIPGEELDYRNQLIEAGLISE